MATESGFSFGSWVWVKQPDYPWWPAMVLDPAQAGQEMPEGCDLILLCGPNAAATLAFANSADSEQVRPFRGADADNAFVQDGRSDESCAAAIEEMLAAAAAATADVPASSTDEVVAAATDFKDTTETALTPSADANAKPSVAEAEKTEKKHKKDKKSKKEKFKSSSSKDKSKSRRRHRSHGGADASSEEEEEAFAGSSEDSDGGSAAYSDEDDEDRHASRRRHHGAADAAAKKARHERQSHLEEYDLGPATATFYPPRSDPDYLSRKLRQARRSATNAELVQAATELRAVTGRCLSGAATAAEVEEEVLRLLRPLTTFDVTVAQLQSTAVGVAVGGLLRQFTKPVIQLANAILNYWFSSLPQTTQQQLSAETEVDRASVDTCHSGGSSGDENAGNLGRIGVKLYDAFTNQEIDDAPPGVKVVRLCKLVEDELTTHCSADAQRLVLSQFSDEGNTGKALRRLLLEGKITAEDVVKHTDDLPTLVRSNQRRPPNILTHTSTLSLNIGIGGGSPTSPNEVFSPNGENTTGSPTFGSPTGRATTSLYTCPQCGANDAYQSSYTVQAHDNMPDILRCKKCGSTWNVADQ